MRLRGPDGSNLWCPRTRWTQTIAISTQLTTCFTFRPFPCTIFEIRCVSGSQHTSVWTCCRSGAQSPRGATAHHGANFDPQERARVVAAPHHGLVGASGPHALWGSSGRPRSLAGGAHFHSGSVASGPSDKSPGGSPLQKPQAGGDRAAGTGALCRACSGHFLWGAPTTRVSGVTPRDRSVKVFQPEAYTVWSLHPATNGDRKRRVQSVFSGRLRALGPWSGDPSQRSLSDLSAWVSREQRARTKSP